MKRFGSVTGDGVAHDPDRLQRDVGGLNSGYEMPVRRAARNPESNTTSA
jgi:hypothetical protein